MEILLALHSIVRWIIIVVAALAIVKFAIGWAGDQFFKSVDRALTSAFSGLMDLQVLLGLIYFIWNGTAETGFLLYRILHLIIMVIAAVAAHIPARFKNLDDKLRFLYSMLVILGALALIFIGISVLPGGITR